MHKKSPKPVALLATRQVTVLQYDKNDHQHNIQCEKLTDCLANFLRDYQLSRWVHFWLWNGSMNESMKGDFDLQKILRRVEVWSQIIFKCISKQLLWKMYVH